MRITKAQDDRAREFLNFLSTHEAAQQHVAEAVDLEKAKASRSEREWTGAIGQFSYSRDATAPWQFDKNEAVKSYKGSLAIAIGAIARKVAMQPAKAYRVSHKKSGEVKEPLPHDHLLVTLFNEVNPIHVQFDLWYGMIMWRLLTGDSYWWKAKNGFGVPVELWPLPSNWVYAVPGNQRFIDRYLVRSVFGKDTEWDADDILHIRNPNPDWTDGGRYYGQASAMQCAEAVDLERAIFRRLIAHFKNFSPIGAHYSTESELSEPQLMDIYQQVVAQRAAAENSGKPIISHSGLKLVDEGKFGGRELDYTQSLDGILDYVLAVHGVPRGAVGLSRDYNRANLEGSMMAFCQVTIDPLLTHLGQQLTQNLARDYDDDIVIEFDPCTVDSFDTLMATWQFAQSAGATTPNEVREELLKRDAFKTGGNRPFVSSAMDEAPIGNEKIEPEPAPQPMPSPPAQQPPAEGDQKDEDESEDQGDEKAQGNGKPSNGKPQNGKPSNGKPDADKEDADLDKMLDDCIGCDSNGKPKIPRTLAERFFSEVSR